MPIEYFSLIDIVLVPVYFFLLLALMLYIRSKNLRDPIISRYLIKGFVFKMIACLFYAALVYFYYGTGDSMSYFREAIVIRNQVAAGNEGPGVLLKSYEQVRYLYPLIGAANEGGWLMEKLVFILTYLTFSRFLLATMVFATIMYSGMIKMAETFSELMPEWRKYIAWVILFFPSLAVYGSGILKDSVCLAGMGWLIYSTNQIFIHHKVTAKYIIILATCIIVISLIKVYIIAAFVVPFLLYLMLLYVRRFKHSFVRKLAFPILIIIMVIGYLLAASSLDEMLGKYGTDSLLESVVEEQGKYLKQESSESGAVFDLGTLEPTISGFLKMMPAGTVATLYRPFIWESRKVLMLFSGIESLFMLLLTLYVMWKTGIRFFLGRIFSEPFVFLCISYTLIFAPLIGLSTYNFGTLARYRIPIIPFYIIGILYILYLHKKKMGTLVLPKPATRSKPPATHPQQ